MTVEERLDKLERNNRVLQVALALVLVAGAGGLLAGQAGRQAVPDVVTARAFHVVSEDGRILVKLEDTSGTGEGVSGTVRTMNSNGQNLVQLGTTTDGEGMVRTQDGKGQDLVLLRVTTGGSGAIVMLNGKGQALVRLAETNMGEGIVTTLNSKGEVLVKLTVASDGTGMVVALDPTGRERRGLLTTRP